jgi:hypothetical protein
VIPAGKWHLFIEFGLWSIAAGGIRCSRVDEQFDKRAFNQLDGQKLISVAYAPESAEWIFRFDLSGMLSIKDRHLETEQDAQWMIFFENGDCLYCEDENRIFLERNSDV